MKRNAYLLVFCVVVGGTSCSAFAMLRRFAGHLVKRTSVALPVVSLQQQIRCLAVCGCVDCHGTNCECKNSELKAKEVFGMSFVVGAGLELPVQKTKKKRKKEAPNFVGC